MENDMTSKTTSADEAFVPCIRRKLAFDCDRVTPPETIFCIAPASLYVLPLEVLDIILHKSYLHWIFTSKTKKRDEEVIRSLISVDACFYQRITRRRFKKVTWRFIGVYYRKSAERSVIRNNRKYLVENIEPNDQLLDLLLSLNCLTEEQVRFIKRLHLYRDKNAELLKAMRPFDERKYSKLIRCLQRTNQETVARVLRSGGVVIRVKTKQSPSETDRILNQLTDNYLEILKDQLGRQSAFWICCKSQRKLQQLQKLIESNALKNWNMDCKQLRREIVIFPISINFVGRLNINYGVIYGVTKLRNEIYVLCRRDYAAFPQCVMYVFDNQNPFRLLKEIAVKRFKYPMGMVSIEKENCLYVAYYTENCIWKITRETGDQLRIIKWLTIDYRPVVLSVSRNGQLMVVNLDSPILRIYSSDAKLLRFIQFSSDIEFPFSDAVETSIGNFIILHRHLEENKTKSRSSERGWKTKVGICEVTGDGQTVIRRFIPSNKTQNILKAYRLLLDSDDRVFVGDVGNRRVILLDFDLMWNQILCSKNEEEENQLSHYPWRFCYDKESKQLIVGDERNEITIYTLSRK